MKSRATCRSFRRVGGTVALAMLAVMAVPALLAQDDGPFRRAASGETAPQQQQGPGPLDQLELRGVMKVGDKTLVTIFDQSNSRCFIVSQGTTMNGLTVSDYQSSDDSVLVQSGGATRRVKMKKATITAMAMPPPTAMPVPAPGMPGSPQAAVTTAAVPADPQAAAMSDEEVRTRMQRVAEEIRRRREMRRQMIERAQQQQTGQPTN